MRATESYTVSFGYKQSIGALQNVLFKGNAAFTDTGLECM